MARKEATRKKAKAATVREILKRVHEAELLTSDSIALDRFMKTRKSGEGEKLLSAVFWLIEAIVNLPRQSRTLRRRLARAEAENLRGVCESFERLSKDLERSAKNRAFEFDEAVGRLDVALVRFSVMAR